MLTLQANRQENLIKKTYPTAATILQAAINSPTNMYAKDLEIITAFAQHLPPLSGNILEMHFNSYANNIDFATRINKDYDAEIIKTLGHKCLRLPVTPLSIFNYGVENIWIEYDAPFNNAPAIFLDIDRNRAFCPQTAFQNLEQITTHYGVLLNPKLLPFMEKVSEINARIIYYGLMFSRQTDSIRLTINDITANNLIQALEKLGWQGNYLAVEKICRTYLRPNQKIVVGVDVGNKLQNRIGIEVFDKDNNGFMEMLCKNNDISVKQFTWLKKWENVINLPETLSFDLTALYQRPVKELHRRINHFKFVVDAAETTAVKGYFYYCF